MSWAPYPALFEANFTELARFGDYWPHLQAARTNFSVPVLLPDVEAPRAVLRILYHPNKPTEPVFHQCADVAIVRRGTPPPTGAVVALETPGAPASATALSTRAVLVDAGRGALAPAFALPPASGLTLIDGMSTALGSTWYGVATWGPVGGGGAGGNATAPPACLVAFPLGAASPTVVNITLAEGGAGGLAPTQWAGLAAAPGWPAASPTGGSLVLLALTQTPDNPNTWVFTARALDPATGLAGRVLSQSAPQDTFVNVLSVADAIVPGGGAGNAAVLHFLTGDENSLFTLGAQVGTAALAHFTVPPSTMTLVSQDVSAWTLSSLHADAASGALLGLSPGLYGNTTWMLVRVDAATGAAAPVGDGVAPAAPGLFASWYGGHVAGRALTPEGGLLHVLRHAVDGSLALAEVDVSTGALRGAPTLLTGVNGAVGLTSFTRVPRD